MHSIYEYRDALNVKGVLEGMSDDIILVHSHHDAVFDGAVQDASGISEMMAVGKYFSQLDKTQRPKTMMFAATDTHYTDYMGHQGFIKRRKEKGDNLILDLVIEHIGKETRLYDFVIKTFEKYGLEKSIFAAVDLITPDDSGEEYVFRQDEVISDAYYFSEAGIPVISTVAGEIYIFHPSDTVERIPQDQLEPVGKAYVEIAAEAAKRL